MTFIAAEGFGKPSQRQLYPTSGDQVPVLRSFYLGFGIGDATPTEYPISFIQILPGGRSEDLSPNAPENPHNVPDGALDVDFSDFDERALEFFYSVSHSLLGIPGVRRFQFRNSGCDRNCREPLPIPSLETGPGQLFPPIIALVGLKFFFNNFLPLRMGQIGVWFRGNELNVAMDGLINLGDDFNMPFSYLVDFAVIPTGPFTIVSSGRTTGRARGSERVNIPSPSNTDFLLTGWRFRFSSGNNNEIRDLGVVRSGDDVTVFYGGNDAVFNWRIDWVHFGRSVLIPTLAD